MSEVIECGCGTRLRRPAEADVVCPRCGVEHTAAVVVLAEEYTAPNRPPRTTPPRHAERMAEQVYDRIAGGTRTRRPAKPGAWRGIAAGVGLMAAAGVIYWQQLDAGLIHTPSVGLAVGGFVCILKALMGYGR